MPVGLPAAGRAPIRLPKKVLPGSRLGGAADADEAAAVLDVALEGGLLRGVERVAGVAEEDDRPVLSRLAAVKSAALWLVSTSKSFAAPSASMAATPALTVASGGPWKTRTLVAGAWALALAAASRPKIAATTTNADSPLT